MRACVCVVGGGRERGGGWGGGGGAVRSNISSLRAITISQLNTVIERL